VNHNQIYSRVADMLRAGQFADAKGILDRHIETFDKDETAQSLYGTMLLRSGDQDGALTKFSENAKAFPNSFAAHADLAFTAKNLGQPKTALTSFERAVDINPAFYQGWVFLSQVAFELDELEKARNADSEAEKHDPLNAEYPKIQAAMRAGNMGQAEQIARGMLQRQPGHPRAAYTLAHLASTVGAHEERADILQHGLDHHPANQMLRRSRVEAFEAIGKYQEAILEAERLVEVAPSYFNYWTLSRVYGHLFEHEKALVSIEKARSHLEADSEEQGKLDLLQGHALKILGRREESEAAYRACIINTPGNGAGWWGLADFKNYTFSGEDISQMQAIVLDDSLDAEQRCQAAFAQAKAYEVLGDLEKAFSCYQEANGLRANLDFSPETHNARFERIKTAYAPEALSVQGSVSADVTPIFILGMPRAGSTLIEQILASHSAVEGTMELMTLPFVERSVRIDMGQKFKVDYPESVTRLTEEDCGIYGGRYIQETAVFRTDKPYFIDKLPPNYERVGLIHKILPQAVIIDARRHPLDCCYSAYKQHFAAGHDYSYDMAHLGAYYNNYLDLMDHWDTVLPGKVIRVQYEQMVADTENTVRGLLEKIGLSFEDSCIRFYENKRAVRTASSEQVRQPINTKGLKPWRDIEDQIEPLKLALGQDTLARFASAE
jgi:tetratricopeptide (TPR) repeat protein